MKAGKLLGAVTRGIYAIINSITWVARVTVGLMVLMVVANIFARFIFKETLFGSLELTELATVLVAFIVVGYTEVNRRHVRVDVLVSRLSGRTQTILAGIMNFIGAAFFLFMVWPAWQLAWADLFPKVAISTILSVPLAPFRFVIALGCLLLGLAMLVNCFHPLPPRAEE